MKIKMLNNETINKIAAGEVIVRPVSVIKELVENAIDAGSTRVVVAVEKGGKTSICVTDNGVGIAYNEVPLAFKRHATSKILKIEDLESIDTLGFRGEALSSISAIARVRITTKTAEEEIGSQSFFEGGAFINQRVCTYDRGTEIMVTDLFYNTPARQKHLQKDKNEEKLIRDILEKLSLSHPEISFTYMNDGREVFKTLGTGQLKDVIESLYGRDFFKGLRELNVENAPMCLKGYISDLTLTRSTREEQIFFINNRFVKNKSLSRAFEDAYEGYMMVHKHPVGIVFIDLPGRMLDVNIHPAKTEIQILNESLVSILFKQGIRDCLKAQNLVVDVSEVTAAPEPSGETARPKPVEEALSFLAGESQNFTPASEINGRPEAESPAPQIPKAEAVRPEAVKMGAEVPHQARLEAAEAEAPAPAPEVPQPRQTFVPAQPTSAETPRVAEPTPEYPIRKGPDFKNAKIIGQLFSTYILLEKGDEIIMLDQHAAHEAFLYQELRERFDQKSDFPAQSLMVPQPVEISVREAGHFDELQPELMRYGFDCDLFGENTLMVRSVPIILGEPQDVSLLKAFIEGRVYEDASDPRNLIERIITMSCKGAVKGHQELSREEIETLLDGMGRLDNPYTCPHGRPIILKLREYELKKLFKRVV
ncbi:DNA mismatch repair endonuclease MutL [Eubacterium sp. 1001713B170207_170306_E7]|uniref:DNA mismatch repair endonuclease MutL n=1 Tax=Eubacterium sp. 1001713B170207_170306_E7 TaxID=2787097 RepID=UPI001899B057|nr:DNA mismatch repair endonuclease MutL [Eubacterium sp. 1001713B170207_170306_E7]